jgi:hypothetical protein
MPKVLNNFEIVIPEKKRTHYSPGPAGILNNATKPPVPEPAPAIAEPTQEAETEAPTPAMPSESPPPVEVVREPYFLRKRKRPSEEDEEDERQHKIIKAMIAWIKESIEPESIRESAYVASGSTQIPIPRTYKQAISDP